MSEQTDTLLHQMASTLLEAALTDTKIEQSLISEAETLITVHQLYVQLLYVGIIIDRVTQLPAYLDALDSVVSDMDLEGIAESSPQVKLRAVSALNQSIKTKVDLVNSMMASKDAIGVLISQMKENFGPNATPEEDGNAQVLGKIRDMSSEQRQKILSGAIQLLQENLQEEK